MPAHMLSPAAMSRPGPVKLRATTVGPEVGNRLRGTVRCNGRIAAVFSSVVYVSLETGLLCITRDGVDPGPFSVMTSAPGHADLGTFGLAVDQAAHTTSRRIVVPGRLEVDLRSVEKWSPDAWPEFPDPDLIAYGLNRLRQCLPANINCTGLGGFVIDSHCPEDGDLVGRAAKASILAARDHVATAGSGTRSTCHWAKQLIGLGPGLTPSGDDFLGGLLIAMHAIGKQDGARQLWAAIGADARAATNSISLALLEAAARGLGSAGLHAAIGAIMSGENPASAVARLSRFGYSSGWDALAGVVAAMETLPKRRREAAA